MATKPLCSIPGCCKPHLARGWCKAHYRRWQRHGDPLGGRPRQARRYLDEVVLTYEGDQCLLWPYGKDRYGYGKIWNGRKKVGLHRLVCEITNGPAPTPKHEAAHSCGNGHLGCCTKRHLSWETHAENMADKIRHGTGGQFRRIAA